MKDGTIYHETGTHFLLPFDKASDYSLTVTSPGYLPTTRVIHRQLSPAFWMNAAYFIPAAALMALALATARDSEGISLLLVPVAGGPLATGVMGMAIDLLTQALWVPDSPRVTILLGPHP